MPMESCAHRNLLLLPQPKNRLRCRHCHLTIKADDLQTRYCPECFETSNKKRFDFEEIAAATSDITHYRCEDCGVLIDSA